MMLKVFTEFCVTGVVAESETIRFASNGELEINSAFVATEKLLLEPSWFATVVLDTALNTVKL